MLSKDDPTVLDAVFLALGNEKRRAILRTLSYRPATVSQLAEEHKLSLPSIHRHIRTLEDAGLLQRRKTGRVHFVAIKRTSLAAAQSWIMAYHLEYGHDDETLDNYIAGLANKKDEQPSRANVLKGRP